MYGATKARKVLLDDMELTEGFTAELIAARRREIQAFANALRNDNLMQHVAGPGGDETFGDLIRLAVEEYGVSQKDISQAIDVNVATVSRWVTGASKAPRLSRSTIIHAIAEILDHELDVT